MPTKLCDGYLEFIFHALLYSILQRELVLLYCMATVDVIVDWTLPFAEGEKKMKDLVNDWELNPFMVSSQILHFLFLGRWLFQVSLVAQW